MDISQWAAIFDSEQQSHKRLFQYLIIIEIVVKNYIDFNQKLDKKNRHKSIKPDNKTPKQIHYSVHPKKNMVHK